MELRFSKEQIGNPVVFIRRCGYGEYYDKRMKITSYMKRARIQDMFPRFHVYIKDYGDKVVFDLHLDQKRVSYKGSHAHSGEYEGGAVEREGKRIKELVEKTNQSS